MLADISHSLNTGVVADIAGINSYFIYTSFSGAKGEPVVKVDICHKGSVHCLFNRFNKVKRLLVWDSEAYYLAACRRQFFCLSNRTFDIGQAR